MYVWPDLNGWHAIERIWPRGRCWRDRAASDAIRTVEPERQEPRRHTGESRRGFVEARRVTVTSAPERKIVQGQALRVDNGDESSKTTAPSQDTLTPSRPTASDSACGRIRYGKEPEGASRIAHKILHERHTAMQRRSENPTAPIGEAKQTTGWLGTCFEAACVDDKA